MEADSLPNGMGTITKALTSGNSVALEVTWTGTHTGPLVGTGGTIPPSGNSWSLPGAQLITFQGDKIKELHQYFDMLTLHQQIGAAQSAATAQDQSAKHR